MSKFWSIIFASVSPVFCKKIYSIRTKLTEEIHFEVCPHRHNASMDVLPRPMLCARRQHRVLAAITNELRSKLGGIPKWEHSELGL